MGRSGLQAPIINWQVKAGYSSAGFAEHKILIIGQGAGTATAQKIYDDVQAGEIATLVGANSMLDMAYKRVQKYNKASEISIIPLAEPAGGVKAQGGFKVTGTATETKDLKINVGDDDFGISVVVKKNDTDAVIAGNIVTAINATSYPFTATIDGADNTLVLLEFKIVGAVGNGLVAMVQNRVNGLDFTEIKTSGGAGAYEAGTALTGLEDRYQTVIFDDAIGFDAIETLLEARVNVTNAIKSGVGLYMKNGTYAEVKDFAKSKNSKTMTAFGNVDVMKYNAIPLLAMAEVGAKRALRLTAGAVLGDLVVEAQEAFGGVSKASLPYHNTPMSYNQPKAKITIEQVQDLNAEGVSLFVPATVGVVLGTVSTLYKFDGAGAEDKTFKYLNAVDTTFAVQEYLFSNCKKRFGQTRVTTGDLIPHMAITNEASVKAEIAGLYEYLTEQGLAQAGKDALRAFKKGISVKLDIANGVYSVDAPVAIVSQFRGLNGIATISYKFN